MGLSFWLRFNEETRLSPRAGERRGEVLLCSEDRSNHTHTGCAQYDSPTEQPRFSYLHDVPPFVFVMVKLKTDAE